MTSSLSSFLYVARAYLRGSNAITPPETSFTIVLGNPSADLDSFISAVVYAYFHAASARKESPRGLFLPLLNLPTTPAHDLWRLRPEFGTALKLAEEPAARQDPDGKSRDEINQTLLKSLATIADLRSASKSTPVSLFSDLPAQRNKDDYVLVDHNALSIPTLSSEDVERHVNITGCIDHHEDESSVPSRASPRIIKMGIGSCTSLVVQHLRDSKLWPGPDSGDATGELARLALAPILIDTANLTAKGKVSDTDRDAVAFLESCIQSNWMSSSREAGDWDRKSFYEDIATTKANSLDLLTIPEIFGRDYKEWNESTKGGEELKIGVSSVVKPITWLLQKAKSVEEFLKQVRDFAHNDEHGLSLYGVMTTSTSESGNFQRELSLFAFSATACKILEAFEAKANKKLDLEPWKESPELLESMNSKPRDSNWSSRLWWQRDVAKSRKQVAPLLRDTVKEC